MKAKIFLFNFLILLISISKLWSTANISNARSIGLAGAYIGLARGVDAPLWNPANLGLSNNSRLSINLVNLGIGVYNNSFTKSQYDIYNGAHWTGEDIDDIFQSIPDDGLKIILNSAGQLTSFSSAVIFYFL